MGRLELRDGGAFVSGGNEEPDPLGTLAQLKSTWNHHFVIYLY